MALPIINPFEFVEPAGLKGANDYHYRHDLTNFLGSERKENAASNGVMLAMSGGNCATAGSLRLAPDGVSLYAAFYPSATIDAFDGLIDDIVAGKADFVVIQDSVLVSAQPLRTFEKMSAKYDQARSYWSGQLHGLAPESGALEDEEAWRCPAISKPQSAWAAVVADATAAIEPFSTQQQLAVADFLQDFSAAGIPVFIVGSPANSYTVEYRAKMHHAARELVGTDLAVGDVSFHQHATQLPDEDFSDPMHLSPSANQPYRYWLNDEIVKTLQDKSDR
jgi:hypothetical protein